MISGWMKKIISTLYTALKRLQKYQVNGKMVTDTLGGDGIMVIDTLGNVLKTWSAWDVWDVANDPYIDEYRYDRFHMNGCALIRMEITWCLIRLKTRYGRLTVRVVNYFGSLVEMGTSKWIQLPISLFSMLPILRNGDLMLFDNCLYDNVRERKLLN